MTYFDHSDAARREKALASYCELKKELAKPKKDNKLSEFALALDHLQDMETKIQQQEKSLQEYHSFFIFLNKLLPRN